MRMNVKHAIKRMPSTLLVHPVTNETISLKYFTMKGGVKSIMVLLMLLLIKAAESQALQNVALNKPCTASTILSEVYPATKAVDGVYHDNQFYHSGMERDPKWWEVDLGKIYFVRSVKLFSRPADDGAPVDQFYSRLKMFSVLTSIHGDSNPLPGGSDWKLCFFQPDIAGASLENNCIGYLAARYVAIYTNNIEPLNIAEVEVYAMEPSLVLQPTNGSCLNLTWPSLFETDSQLVYMFRCARINWSNTTALTASVCNLTPWSYVTCSWGYRRTEGAVILQAANAARMYCAEPSTPTVNYTQRATEIAQEQRITLVIVWSISAINCNFLTKVRICVATSEKTAKCLFTLSGGATIENLDPFRNYTLSVMAVNNQNWSSELILNITTRELEPSDPPSDFLVRSLNGSCVLLSWNPPRRPNGIIMGYEYVCQPADNWTALIVTNNASTTNNHLPVCGFSPLRQIKCSIWAFNSAGSSPKDSRLTRTYMDASMFSDLTVGLTVDNIPSVSWKPMHLGNYSPTIRSFRIIVIERQYGETMENKWKTDFNVCQDYNTSRTILSTCYIAADLTASEQQEVYTLNVGDGLNYSGFWNVPLKKELSYLVSLGFRAGFEEREKGDEIYYYGKTYPLQHQNLERVGSNLKDISVTINAPIIGLSVTVVLFVGSMIANGILCFKLRKISDDSQHEKLRGSGTRKESLSSNDAKPFIDDPHYVNGATRSAPMSSSTTDYRMAQVFVSKRQDANVKFKRDGGTIAEMMRNGSSHELYEICNTSSSSEHQYESL